LLRYLARIIFPLGGESGVVVMVFIVAMILFVVVMGWLDSRLRWPKPNDRTRRFVSVAERSTSLRR
jgi:uncharacterized membrane protein